MSDAVIGNNRFPAQQVEDAAYGHLYFGIFTYREIDLKIVEVIGTHIDHEDFIRAVEHLQYLNIVIVHIADCRNEDLTRVGKDAGQSAGVGTGGMRSKLLAAQKAGQKQIVTHLVRGDIPHNLLSIAQGNSLGTQIGGRE